MRLEVVDRAGITQDQLASITKWRGPLYLIKPTDELASRLRQAGVLDEGDTRCRVLEHYPHESAPVSILSQARDMSPFPQGTSLVILSAPEDLEVVGALAIFCLRAKRPRTALNKRQKERLALLEEAATAPRLPNRPALAWSRKANFWTPNARYPLTHPELASVVAAASDQDRSSLHARAARLGEWLFDKSTEPYYDQQVATQCQALAEASPGLEVERRAFSRIAVVSSALPGSELFGYTVAPVVVNYVPLDLRSTSGEMGASCRISQFGPGYVRMLELLAKLGWSGDELSGRSGPEHASSLDLEQVLSLVDDCYNR